MRYVKAAMAEVLPVRYRNVEAHQAVRRHMPEGQAVLATVEEHDTETVTVVAEALAGMAAVPARRRTVSMIMVLKMVVPVVPVI